MKRFVLVVLSVCLGLSARAASLKTETIMDQGLERTYYLYIPDNLPAGAPLVFVLHGYGGKAENYQPKYYPLADEFGFAVCCPQASPDPRGKNSWNVGYPWQIDAMQVDDIEFVIALKNSLVERYGFSSENVFFTGNSNGGEMCYLMAMRKPREFAAIASMYGLCLVDMLERYSFTEPVDFLELHGTADKTSRWEGDLENKYGWGAYMNVPMAVGCMVAVNKCVVEQTEELPLVKNRVIKHTYYGSPLGKEVVFYEVENGGHNMQTDSFDSHRAVFEFFRSHLK